MVRLHDATQAAIDQLVPVLERRLPSLLNSLNPPVSTGDLDALKRAIEPYELPSEYETWLRFADGQRDQADWWPVIDGPLLPAAQMLDFYAGGLEFQPPGLLPISYASQDQVSIELANEKSPALIDTTVSSVEWRVVAPSMPGLLAAVRQLVESGEIDDWPDFYTLEQDQSDWHGAVQRYEARRSAIATRSADLLGRSNWSHSPFAQGEWFDRGDGPSYWGPFPEL